QRQMIERSSQRITGLLELISDLLDISRIELGQAFQEPKCVLPLEVLKAPLEDCMVAAQQKRISVEVRVPSDLPGIKVFPSRIQQVFANLLSNAVKFTPEGGRIVISARRDDNNIRFEVSDTGIGIPPQDLPRMFEEFFRASNVQTHDKTTGQITGTGLGLAIVRRILEKYGGKIWVESPDPDTGCGTRFTFLLPACQADESLK
ncbi:MAG: HAMP domain-containing histidine kinase, partial [Dehalococcoidia bacterium]|nr:HAMP domain-containing histidine kinase [Dehalococcoidia bacterium]